MLNRLNTVRPILTFTILAVILCCIFIIIIKEFENKK